MNTIPKYQLGAIFDPEQAHPDDAHSQLMRLIPSGARVLELGCATGYLSGYMEQALGCQVIGMEMHPPSVEIARTRCTAVYQADLDAPCILDQAAEHGPFDVLLAAAVLEHLKYPERLLCDAKPLLKPGGRIIVSLPNIANWRIRLNLLRGRFDYEDYGIMDRTHLRLFTLKTGHELIASAGYAVDAVHIAGSGVQNAVNAWYRRRKRPLPQRLIWPEGFAYELIYVASLPPA